MAKTYKGAIAGGLTIEKGDDASAVTSIGGYLYVRQGATCDLPQVTSIGGSLYVRQGATCDLPQITSIGGSLYVSEGATCDLPQVTSIGGSLDVRQGATCDLPQVTSIGGSLYVRQGATCDLPQVTSIGGSLEIKPRGRLTAPNLRSIAGEPVSSAEDQSSLLKQVADHALADPSAFTMSDWHACGTAHCIAGWAVHLRGKEGYELEKKVGPATAGALLLGTDAAAMFFLSKDEATGRLEMIRQGVAA